MGNEFGAGKGAWELINLGSRGTMAGSLLEWAPQLSKQQYARWWVKGRGRKIIHEVGDAAGIARGNGVVGEGGWFCQWRASKERRGKPCRGRYFGGFHRRARQAGKGKHKAAGEGRVMIFSWKMLETVGEFVFYSILLIVWWFLCHYFPPLRFLFDPEEWEGLSFYRIIGVNLLIGCWEGACFMVSFGCLSCWNVLDLFIAITSWDT